MTPATLPIRLSISLRTLEDLGGKVTESEKAPIKAAIEKLRETLKGSDTAAIKADTEALQQAFYSISEKLYQQQADQQGGTDAGNAGNTGKGDDGVVDADYEVVDDDQ